MIEEPKIWTNVLIVGSGDTPQDAAFEFIKDYTVKFPQKDKYELFARHPISFDERVDSKGKKIFHVSARYAFYFIEKVAEEDKDLGINTFAGKYD